MRPRRHLFVVKSDVKSDVKCVVKFDVMVVVRFVVKGPARPDLPVLRHLSVRRS
jgi:hypothetical protein